MKVHNIKQRLIRKALNSCCKFKIAAIGLSATGDPLCCAFNSPRFSRKGGGVHAEMKVLHKSPPNLKTIILCRINKNGDLRPIHPCETCARKAAEKGVKIIPISVD